MLDRWGSCPTSSRRPSAEMADSASRAWRESKPSASGACDCRRVRCSVLHCSAASSAVWRARAFGLNSTDSKIASIRARASPAVLAERGRDSCRHKKEHGRRADCSAMPGVRRCDNARMWPSKRVLRLPAIPAPSDPESGAPHGSRCKPGQQTHPPLSPVRAHSRRRSWRCPRGTGHKFPGYSSGWSWNGHLSVEISRGSRGNPNSLQPPRLHPPRLVRARFVYRVLQDARTESYAARGTAGCCGKWRKCQADVSLLPAKPHRSRLASDAQAHGRTCNSARPDHAPLQLAHVCFGEILSLHRHGTARILLGLSAKRQQLRADHRGRIGRLRRRACYGCCWTHERLLQYGKSSIEP